MYQTRSCPGCDTGGTFHAAGCSLSEFEQSEIERAHVDILSRLTVREEPWTFNELRDDIETAGDDISSQVAFASTGGESTEHPGWTPLHEKCLHKLKQAGRVAELDDGIQISEPGDHQQGVIPQHDPLRTVYEYGPIDGCKDYAVYSMVSWCELRNLDWDQTVAFIDHWLTTTGRWESESWGEASPKQLAQSKQHIHDRGLGWGEYPEMAKTEMEASSKTRQLDADSMAAAIDRDVLSKNMTEE